MLLFSLTNLPDLDARSKAEDSSLKGCKAFRTENAFFSSFYLECFFVFFHQCILWDDSNPNEKFMKILYLAGK